MRSLSGIVNRQALYKIHLPACSQYPVECTVHGAAHALLSLYSGTLPVCWDDCTPVHAWD